MDTQRPYIDEMLNRRSLATMLSTNHRYIEEVIRKVYGFDIPSK